MESPKPFGKQQFSPEERAHIRDLLQKKLGREHLSTRPGSGGATFTYVESWKVIHLANQIFGFNGWASSVVDITPDYIEQTARGRYSAGVTAVVRVTLKDGTYHEDVGFGITEHPSKGTAIENAKKEAVSDARKRALRLFGNALGNSIYDKQHIRKVKKGSLSKDVLTDEPVNPYVGNTVNNPPQATASNTPPQQTNDSDTINKPSIVNISTNTTYPPSNNQNNTFVKPTIPPTNNTNYNQASTGVQGQNQNNTSATLDYNSLTPPSNSSGSSPSRSSSPRGDYNNNQDAANVIPMDADFSQPLSFDAAVLAHLDQLDSQLSTKK